MGHSLSIVERRPLTRLTDMPNIVTRHLRLEHVDFRRSPTNKSSIRTSRTGVRFALARARAEPLAGQERELAVFARVTVCVRTWGRGIGEGLVRKGADVASVLQRGQSERRKKG